MAFYRVHLVGIFGRISIRRDNPHAATEEQIESDLIPFGGQFSVQREDNTFFGHVYDKTKGNLNTHAEAMFISYTYVYII